MGKMNNIILIPSAEAPFGEDALQCSVFYNFLNIGIPAIWYKWSFRKSKIKDSGSFLWVGMSEIYGIFNSAETVLSDMGILDFLMDVRNKLAKKSPPRRYYYGSQNYGILKLDIEKQGELVKEDSTEAISEVCEREEVLNRGGDNVPGSTGDTDILVGGDSKFSDSSKDDETGTNGEQSKKS
jgi:hypothetical protein